MKLMYRLLAGDIPNPGLGDAPAAVQTRINTVLDLVAWVMVAGCVGAVLFCGGRMAWAARRGETDDHFRQLGMIGGGCTLIGSAAALVAFLL